MLIDPSCTINIQSFIKSKHEFIFFCFSIIEGCGCNFIIINNNFFFCKIREVVISTRACDRVEFSNYSRGVELFGGFEEWIEEEVGVGFG